MRSTSLQSEIILIRTRWNKRSSKISTISTQGPNYSIKKPEESKWREQNAIMHKDGNVLQTKMSKPYHQAWCPLQIKRSRSF